MPTNRDRITELLDHTPDPDQPTPPHPTDTTDDVRALARALDALAFGGADWRMNFRTEQQLLAPLAQAILNWQAGWVLDPETHTWIQTEEAA